MEELRGDAVLQDDGYRPNGSKVYKRSDLDWYVESEECTDALCTVERFTGSIWDPACGQGNAVRALLRAGHLAVGTDVVKRGLGFCEGWRGEHDFLTGEPAPHACFSTPANFVMNPPFFRAVGAEAFARKALSIAKGKVAVFSDVRFLLGGKRAVGFYAEHRPARVWLLSPRPSCPPGDFLLEGGKAEGGSQDWCWIVWDTTVTATETKIDWLSMRKS